MAIHAISFRIENTGNYSERWKSVVDAVVAESGGPGEYWDETTAFFVIESQFSATDLADFINLRSLFDTRRDKLLVINLSAKEYAALGNIEYPYTLGSLMGRR